MGSGCGISQSIQAISFEIRIESRKILKKLEISASKDKGGILYKRTQCGTDSFSEDSYRVVHFTPI